MLEEKQIIEQNEKSYIETERIVTARAPYPHEAKLSQLIQENHLKQKELLKQAEEKQKGLSLINSTTLAEIASNHNVLDLLEQSLQYAKRNEMLLVLVYIKLSSIKQIENIYGFHASTELLNIVAKRLINSINNKNYLTRLNRRKYLVGSLVKREGLKGTEKTVSQIKSIVSKPIDVEGFKIKIDVHTSSVAYPIHGDNVRVLLDIAEFKNY